MWCYRIRKKLDSEFVRDNWMKSLRAAGANKRTKAESALIITELL